MRILVSLLAFLILAAVAVGDDLGARMDKIESEILAGNTSAQKIPAKQVFDAVVKQGALDTEQGIRSVRLVAQTGEKPDVVSLRRLTEKSTKLFGAQGAETIRTRIALAGALWEAGEKEEARSLWKALGEEVAARDKDVPSIDLANCFYGYGLALLEAPRKIPRASFKVGGNPALPIREQCTWESPLTKNTQDGLRFLRHSVTIHEKADAETAHLRRRKVESTVAPIEREAAKAIERAVAETKARIKEELEEEVRLKIGTWYRENAEPLVWICLAKDANAYHKRQCSSLEKCELKEVPWSVAIEVGRIACDACDVVEYYGPPGHLYDFDFDGKNWTMDRFR